MFDQYQPEQSALPLGILMEVGVYVLACVMALHAHSQRANWRFTLFLGMLAGIVLEVLIVISADKNRIYYEYGTDQFLISIWNVPVCIGVGWGIVLYASTWTAHRLNIPWIQRAMVAGALAVNIDLTLDPLAHQLGFWTWKGLEKGNVLSYYGVPFDNYVAWFGIVALFSLSTRGGFRGLDKWFPRGQESVLKNWTNAVVPLLGLALSGGLFLLARKYIGSLYELLDGVLAPDGSGEATLFLGLYILTAYFLWSHNLASRRDMAIHWPILAVPIFFHVACMILLILHGVANQPTLLVLMPMTAVVAFFSYVWPSIDTFLNNGNARMRDRQRRAVMRVLEQLTPEKLAKEESKLADLKIPVAKKRSLAAYEITDLLHALQDPEAGPRYVTGEPHEVYQNQQQAIARVLHDASAALENGHGRGGRLEQLADELMKAADRAARDTDVETKTLFSYGGHSVQARVHRPGTRAQLQSLLVRLRKGTKPVSFRAGGNAFDRQSLNEVVISLERFDDIRVDADNRRVTVGAGATWGDILKETLKHNLVPYVMVTTRAATAGGTLSADSLSRLSPTCGKEGLHVISFVLMRPDGTEVVCSREHNRELFRAAIAGLGYVGAVIEITYELLRVPFDAAKIAVRTEFRTCSLEEVAAQLVARVHGTARCVRRVNGDLVCEPENPFKSLKALSAVIYLRGPGKGLIAESHYDEVEPKQWKRSPFHDPFSVKHLLLQIGAHIPGARAIAYWFIFSVLFKKAQRFVDEIFGYTFFEDGNHLLRRWGRSLGLPMGIRQQTFVVRWNPDDIPSSQAQLKAFLDRAEALLDKRRLSPALIDVLYVPDDGSDDFLLTSNYDLAGFAVTYTFERIFSRDFPEEEAFFQELSKIVHAAPFCGRVHLVKNVHADPGLIEQMYGPRLITMAAVRDREGVTNFLQNKFMNDVLPSLTRSTQPSSSPGSVPPPSSEGTPSLPLSADPSGAPAGPVVAADGASE